MAKYGYCRVSSKTQLDGYSLEVQRKAILDKYIDAIIVEEQYTGTTTNRHEFVKLIETLKEGDVLVVQKWNNPELDTITFASSDNGTTIMNQLSSADPNLNEAVEEEVVFLTRNNWEGTMPTGEIVKLTLTDALVAALQEVVYKAENYEEIESLSNQNAMRLFKKLK